MKLELNLGNDIPIFDRFFDTFSEFKAIQTLRIYSRHNTVLKGSIESLKYCKQLKHLDLDYLKFTEDFFTKINVFLPKLQFICFSSRKKFSDSFIDSFLSMKNIQKVIIHVYNLPIIEYYTKYYYFGKCLSEIMLSPYRLHVIRFNDNSGHITRYKGAKYSEEGL